VNSLVFAEYLNRVLWNVTRGDDAPSKIIPLWVINTTAVAAVVFVFALVVGTCSLGPRATVILTSIKVKPFCLAPIRSAVVIPESIKVLALVRRISRWVGLLPQADACGGSSPLSYLDLFTNSLGTTKCAGTWNPSSIHPLRLRRMRSPCTPVFGHLMASIKPIMSLEKCATQHTTFLVRSTYPWGS
jgi:hypothetical protein